MNRTQPGSEYDPESENDSDGIEYPINCDECGRGFLTQKAHNAHQRVHADDDVIVAPDGGQILEGKTESKYEQLREVYNHLVDRAEELALESRGDDGTLLARREELLDAIDPIEDLLNDWAQED